MSQSIVFVHGYMSTTAVWDKWVEFFSARGYECIAPNWLYMDRPVE